MLADTVRLFGAIFWFLGTVIWEIGVVIVGVIRRRRIARRKPLPAPWPPPVI